MSVISFGPTYLLNGDVEDVINIFGEPNPDEDDAEDLDTIAVWRSKKWVFYYTGAECDPWEMPEGGPHEFLVSGNVKAFEAEVKNSKTYCLANKEMKHDLQITIKHLVKTPCENTL